MAAHDSRAARVTAQVTARMPLIGCGASGVEGSTGFARQADWRIEAGRLLKHIDNKD